MELKRDSFKAYDIRGKYPEEVNEDLAYAIGRVFADMLQAKKVAVGHDIRLSGPSLQEALVRGLNDAGCDVVDIGHFGRLQVRGIRRAGFRVDQTAPAVNEIFCRHRRTVRPLCVITQGKGPGAVVITLPF